MTTPPRKRPTSAKKAPAAKVASAKKAPAAKVAPAKKAPAAKVAPAKKAATPRKASSSAAARASQMAQGAPTEAVTPIPPPPSDPVISPDGRYEWDGKSWVARTAPPPPPPAAPVPPPVVVAPAAAWTPPSGKSLRAQARVDKAARKAQRNWILRHKILTGTAVLIVLIVVIIIADSISGGGKSVPAAVDSPAAGASTTAGASAAPTRAAGTEVLLDVSGNGAKTTNTFTAKGQWDLFYTYKCTGDFASSGGNFIVEVLGSDNAPSLSNDGVDTLGTGGSDVTHEHNGGSYYLTVDSECSWTIKVTG
jgi:hypothetical protein